MWNTGWSWTISWHCQCLKRHKPLFWSSAAPVIGNSVPTRHCSHKAHTAEARVLYSACKTAPGFVSRTRSLEETDFFFFSDAKILIQVKHRKRVTTSWSLLLGNSFGPLVETFLYWRCWKHLTWNSSRKTMIQPVGRNSCNWEKNRTNVIVHYANNKLMPVLWIMETRMQLL